jgi:hypothetical protein
MSSVRVASQVPDDRRGLVADATITDLADTFSPGDVANPPRFYNGQEYATPELLQTTAKRQTRLLRCGSEPHVAGQSEYSTSATCATNSIPATVAFPLRST